MAISPIGDPDPQGAQHWQQSLHSCVQVQVGQVRCQHTPLLQASICLDGGRIHCIFDDYPVPRVQVLDEGHQLGWKLLCSKICQARHLSTGSKALVRSSMPKNSVCCLSQKRSHSKRRLNRASEQLLSGLNPQCGSRSCCCSQPFSRARMSWAHALSVVLCNTIVRYALQSVLSPSFGMGIQTSCLKPAGAVSGRHAPKMMWYRAACTASLTCFYAECSLQNCLCCGQCSLWQCLKHLGL